MIQIVLTCSDCGTYSEPTEAGSIDPYDYCQGGSAGCGERLREEGNSVNEKHVEKDFARKAIQ